MNCLKRKFSYRIDTGRTAIIIQNKVFSFIEDTFKGYCNIHVTYWEY
jgi:hypothetical protein